MSPERPLATEMIIRTAVVLRCELIEVGSGANVIWQHNQQVVVDASGLLTFENPDGCGISLAENVRVQGVVAPRCLASIDDVVSEREGQESDPIYPVLLDQVGYVPAEGRGYLLVRSGEGIRPALRCSCF